MKKTGLIVFVFLLLSLLIIGCVNESTGGAGFFASETDSAGKLVALDAVPERIVSMAPSNTEILFALGLGDKLVGVTDYCNYPAEAREIEKIGGFADPSVEKIVSLNPDIIFGTSALQVEIVEKLEGLGYTVFIADAGSVSGTLELITKIGNITGGSEKAGLLVASLQERVNAITEKTHSLDEGQKPIVFVEIWADPLMTAGPNTFHYNLVDLAGGKNALEVDGEWVMVNAEAVIDANPDVIIGTQQDMTIDIIRSRAGWESIAAVSENRVFYPDPDSISRAGPRLIDVLEELATFLHPELFE